MTILIIAILFIITFSLFQIMDDKIWITKELKDENSLSIKIYAIWLYSWLLSFIIWILVWIWYLFWFYQIPWWLWYLFWMSFVSILIVWIFVMLINFILYLFKRFILDIFLIKWDKNWLNISIMKLTWVLTIIWFYITKVISWTNLNILTLWIWLITMIILWIIWMSIYKIVIKTMLIQEYKIAKIEDNSYTINQIKEALKNNTLDSILSTYKNIKGLN